MDRIAEQLAAYHRVPTAPVNVAWAKVRILETLEADLADERVLDMFLAVAADPGEFDMARCHVLRHLEFADISTPADRRKVGECLAAALSREDDWTVLCWLGRAAQDYGEVSELLRVATERVLDPGEYEDVRFNCLPVLTRLGPTPVVVAALRQLARGKDTLAESARKTLRAWGQDAEHDAADRRGV